MNVDKNGQQFDEDDASLTAFALGELEDPDEIARLQTLLKEDSVKRKEFEEIRQIGGLIRESVDSDLPMAPGSLHDIVLSELDSVGRTDLVSSAANKGPQTKRAWTRYRQVVSLSLSLSLLVGFSLAMWRPWEERRGVAVRTALADQTESTINKAASMQSEMGLTTDNHTESKTFVTDGAKLDEDKASTAKAIGNLYVEDEKSQLFGSGGNGVEKTENERKNSESSPVAGDQDLSSRKVDRDARQLKKIEKQLDDPHDTRMELSQDVREGVLKAAPGGGGAGGGNPSQRAFKGAPGKQSDSRGVPSPTPSLPDRRAPSSGGAAAFGAGGGKPGNGGLNFRPGANQPFSGEDSGSADKSGLGGKGVVPREKSKRAAADAMSGQPQLGGVTRPETLVEGGAKSTNEKRSRSSFDKKRQSSSRPSSAKDPKRLSNSITDATQESSGQQSSEQESSGQNTDGDVVQDDRPGDAGSEKESPPNPLIADYENDFMQPLGTNALSTFSIDTDTASYTNVRQMLRNNQWPDPNRVRIEELINFFDYSYPQPQAGSPFSVNMELASSPWTPGNKLLRVGLKAAEVENTKRPPSNLVFLIDVSGSMRNSNKLPLLKSGLKSMVDQLGEDDYVSIVTYSDVIKSPLPPTDGSQKEKIKNVIDALAAKGSTNGSGGLREAYRAAKKHFLKGGSNRIVMGTDGDFNVGIKDDAELVEFIREQAQSGVFLTICGFGTGNFKDEKVQKMAQNGNGKVYFIDSQKESKRVFVEKISGGLVTVAKDVKLQLIFNPRTVQSYRLIGYETRRLKASDFDDDSKDAGEMDAGDDVTALYEIVPADEDFSFPTLTHPESSVDLKYQVVQKQTFTLTKSANSDDIAALRVRFKRPSAEKSELREFVVKNNVTHYSRASKDMKFVSTVAGLGLMLRGSRHRGSLNFAGLKELAQGAMSSEMKDPKSGRSSGVDPAKTPDPKNANNQPATPAESAETELGAELSRRKELLELIDRAAALSPDSSATQQ